MSTKEPLIRLKQTNRNGNFLTENINTSHAHTRGGNTAGRSGGEPEGVTPSEVPPRVSYVAVVRSVVSSVCFH